MKKEKEQETEIKDSLTPLLEEVNDDEVLDNKTHFPWFVLILCGVLVVLMIVCIIVIMCLGGPI